jgi:hypothetical protein
MYFASSNFCVNRTPIPCGKLCSFLGTSGTITRNHHREPSPETITGNMKYTLVKNMAIQLLNAMFDFCENTFTGKLFMRSFHSQNTKLKILGITLFSHW